MDKIITKGGVESIKLHGSCGIYNEVFLGNRSTGYHAKGAALSATDQVFDCIRRNERSRQSRVNYLQFLQLFLKRTERSLLMFVELVSLGLCSAESGDLTKAQPT